MHCTSVCVEWLVNHPSLCRREKTNTQRCIFPTERSIRRSTIQLVKSMSSIADERGMADDDDADDALDVTPLTCKYPPENQVRCKVCVKESSLYSIFFSLLSRSPSNFDEGYFFFIRLRFLWKKIWSFWNSRGTRMEGRPDYIEYGLDCDDCCRIRSTSTANSKPFGAWQTLTAKTHMIQHNTTSARIKLNDSDGASHRMKKDKKQTRQRQTGAVFRLDSNIFPFCGIKLIICFSFFHAAGCSGLGGGKMLWPAQPTDKGGIISVCVSDSGRKNLGDDYLHLCASRLSARRLLCVGQQIIITLITPTALIIPWLRVVIKWTHMGAVGIEGAINMPLIRSSSSNGHSDAASENKWLYFLDYVPQNIRK